MAILPLYTILIFSPWSRWHHPLAFDDSGEGNAAHLLWHAAGDAILFVEAQDVANGRGEKTAYSMVIQQVLPVYLPTVAR